MYKVYTCDNIMLAGLVKSRLEGSGIACIMKNESLTGGIGELPPIECWPEVWITDDSDLSMAERIIESMRNQSTANSSPWQCRCGEAIEAQFTQCWKCGRERPD